MKNKTIKLICLLLSLITLFGCQSKSQTAYNGHFSASRYINLPEYRKITISKEDYVASDEELDIYIFYELLSKEIYSEEKLVCAREKSQIRKLLTDKICNTYYNISTTEETVKYFKKTLETERIWNVYYEYIVDYVETSVFPVDKDIYVNQKISILEAEAKDNNQALDDYITETYDITLIEYTDALIYNFLEIMTIYALAENENISFSATEISDIKQTLCNELQISDDTLTDYYNEYDIYYTLYVQKLKTCLASDYLNFS